MRLRILGNPEEVDAVIEALRAQEFYVREGGYYRLREAARQNGGAGPAPVRCYLHVRQPRLTELGSGQT